MDAAHSLDAQLEALRAKYAPLAAERDSSGPSASLIQVAAPRDVVPRALASARVTTVEPELLEVAARAGGASRAPGEPESRASICSECKGSGVTSSVYNHRVMERTCRLCEGEGVIVSQKVQVEERPAGGGEASGDLVAASSIAAGGSPCVGSVGGAAPAAVASSGSALDAEVPP